jgi:hypothetical protein
VWHQKKSGRKAALTVESLVELGDDRLAELDAQVDRLGDILAVRPELTLGEVTVGGHA